MVRICLVSLRAASSLADADGIPMLNAGNARLLHADTHACGCIAAVIPMASPFGVGGAGLHVPCNESERIKWHLVCLSLGLMSRATRNDQAALAWAHRLPLAAGAKAAGQGCWAGPAVGIGVAPRAEGRALVMP